jgi:hypothetical protein
MMRKDKRDIHSEQGNIRKTDDPNCKSMPLLSEKVAETRPQATLRKFSAGAQML